MADFAKGFDEIGGRVAVVLDDQNPHARHIAAPKRKRQARLRA
jgi:hypothetical protein